MILTRKTNFTGGGLLESPHIFAGLPENIPDNFEAPEYVDSRPYCIKASNQGTTPHCAGFAMAGLKEVRHWRATGIKEQFDGHKCYKLAKTLDGMPGIPGTSLYAAALAAQQLGWIASTEKLAGITNAEFLKFALHKYGCCLAGFNMNSNWNLVKKSDGQIGNKSNPKPLGGHAVLVCYYDGEGVGFQNSWGISWGVSGFGWMTWEQFHEQFKHAVVFE